MTIEIFTAENEYFDVIEWMIRLVDSRALLYTEAFVLNSVTARCLGLVTA